jgi:hypothetical protein
MNPASIPNLDPIVPTITAAAAAQTPSRSRLLLVALPIVLPGSLMVNTALPLLVRGVSAIVCGLAVLLCGPHLYCRGLAWMVHRCSLRPKSADSLPSRLA